jgi:hypothetical protein
MPPLAKACRGPAPASGRRAVAPVGFRPADAADPPASASADAASTCRESRRLAFAARACSRVRWGQFAFLRQAVRGVTPKAERSCNSNSEHRLTWRRVVAQRGSFHIHRHRKCGLVRVPLLPATWMHGWPRFGVKRIGRLSAREAGHGLSGNRGMDHPVEAGIHGRGIMSPAHATRSAALGAASAPARCRAPVGASFRRHHHRGR